MHCNVECMVTQPSRGHADLPPPPLRYDGAWAPAKVLLPPRSVVFLDRDLVAVRLQGC
jgi:hypothetical protein